MTHMPATSQAPYDSYVTVYDATEYGADRTGTIASNDAIERVLAAGSGADNFEIFFPPGTYLLERDGGNSWCVDLPSNVTIRGIYGKSILKHPAGLSAADLSFFRADEQTNLVFRDLKFDGNWGNRVTEIEEGSDRVALPQATINVGTTEGFPSSGTFYLRLTNNTLQTITYTGLTSTSFTGCSGGTGRMYRHDLVGYVDTNQNGINHVSQGINPSNFGLILRGCSDVLIEHCIFYDMFGDGVWMGTPSDDDLQQPSRDIQIIGCLFDICARNAISFGASTVGCVIERCVFRDVFNTAIDSEPNYLYGGVRDIVIRDNYIRGWFSGSNASFMISAVGGDTTAWNISGAARSWRIENNFIHGIVHIDCASDIIVRGNRIITDNRDPDLAYAPIYCVGPNDGIVIDDNWIYDTATKSIGSSGPHNGAIHVTFAGAGSINVQPSSVRVTRNRIFARGGVNGIWVNSHGGFTFGLTAVSAATSGTASGVTDVSLTDSSKSWTSDQYIGWTVRMGGMHAMIIDNTDKVLSLQPGHPSVEPYAWRHPLGRVAQTPAAGAYTIQSLAGFLDISDNHIDCGYDGNTAGGNGIYLFNDRAGGRISVRDNYIKNATDWGIHVVGDTTVPVLFLELRGNRIWDDQASATCSAAIRFASAASLTSIVKLVMNDNSTTGGVSTLLSGVSAGRWLLADGYAQQWIGHGVPSHSAPQGSTYINVSGTGADSIYVNTDGGTTWSAR